MTFAAQLRRWARESPAKPAAVDSGRRLTYAELDGLVDSVAGCLVGEGVGPGSVVSSQLPNRIESLTLALAANRIGAVHNPIVVTHGRRELAFILDQAGSAVLVTDDRLEHGRAAAVGVDAPFDPDAVAFLLYTSGTEADPKGVLHSNRTLLAECEAQVRFHGLTADEVFVMPSPVGHISGLLYGELLPVWLGATTVLMDAWDPGRFLELVERERGTFCGGATPFLQGVVDHPDVERADVSSLRLFPCGGADVPPDLIRRAIERLDVRTGRGYGSTEFPSITSSAGPDEPLEKRAETDGRPIGRNRIVIRDGEIRATGPELFFGYRDASLDADAFDEDGLFRTGDLGFLDDDGYLVVTGRSKDVVIRKGETFSAREVEDLVHAHPKVARVAIVPVPDPRTGEQACAVVVPHDVHEPPTLVEINDFLVAHELSRRKLPERLEVVDDLPMTASGKVRKDELRRRLAGGA